MSLKPYTAPPFYPPPRPSNAVVLALKGHYQVREYTCGFASTLTVLRYYQRSVTERELYERLGTTCEGTSQSAILRELRREGIRVGLRYDMEFEDIREAISAGRLIVAYHHRLEHWLVINGFRDEPRSVFVVDSLRNHRCEQSWVEYGPKLRGFGMICSTRKRRLSVPTIDRHLAIAS